MRKTRSDNSSGYPGISRNKGAWQAEIRRGGKYVYQARFPTIEAAVAGRAEAMKALGIPDRNVVRREVPPPPPVEGARWIPLTKGKFALVDEADYEDVARFNWYFIAGYAKRRERYTLEIIALHDYLIHPQPGFEVDHVNRDGLDCRRGNMRTATHAQNMQNCARRRHNTSGFIGVSFDRRTRRWFAQARASGKPVFLGRFDSAEEAARARDAWVKVHHGPFASLNFPEGPTDPEKPSP